MLQIITAIIKFKGYLEYGLKVLDVVIDILNKWGISASEIDPELQKKIDELG